MLGSTSFMQNGMDHARQALLVSLCQAASSRDQQQARGGEASCTPRSGDENQADGCSGDATQAGWMSELVSRSALAQRAQHETSRAPADAQQAGVCASAGAGREKCSADLPALRTLSELMGGSLSAPFLEHVLRRHRGDVAVRLPCFTQ